MNRRELYIIFMTFQTLRPVNVLTLLSLFLFLQSTLADKFHLYIGTYTQGDSEGIYSGTWDSENGKISDLKLAAKVSDPSFLAIHPDGHSLYAVLETGEWDDMKNSGGLAALKRDPVTGALSLLNKKATYGAHPCHLEIHPSGQHVFFANYSGGSIGVYSIHKNRSLSDLTGFVQFTGGSIHRSRQTSPHGHAIHLSPDGQYVMSADLGVDCIHVHKFDQDTGTLSPHHPSYIPVKPGSGPRHFAFHPAGKTTLILNEMSSVISSYKYNSRKGILTFHESQSTLPDNFDGRNSTAEVVIHPNGKFAYCSNRGHDSIAVFQITNRGGLKRIQIIKTGGKTPRNFNIDPSGNWLIAANQSTNNLTIFKLNKNSGKLEFFGEPINVPTPVCVRFAPSL